MSEETNEVNLVDEVEDDLMPDELTILKNRADLLGLKYHHRAGVEKLKEAIKQHLATDKAKEMNTVVAQGIAEQTTDVDYMDPMSSNAAPETDAQRRQRLHKEAGKLIRIRVANMNPNKKDWDGEIITVSNELVGTFKKYVPFNAEEGWHVPQIILNVLQERKCQVFHDVKVDGVNIRKGKLIKEFAIEILPPLTQAELKDLANQQAMAAGNAA